jgi:uncharacterized protein
MDNKTSKYLKKALTAYKLVSNCLFRNTCRFVPTCSEYMVMAIDKKGFVKGGWLGIKRICKCHPFHHGGYDPI